MTLFSMHIMDAKRLGVAKKDDTVHRDLRFSSLSLIMDNIETGEVLRRHAGHLTALPVVPVPVSSFPVPPSLSSSITSTEINNTCPAL